MKNSNAKTMLRKILLLAALVAANGAEAQIKTILKESLVDRFTYSPSVMDNHPAGFTGWNFNNCYTVPTNGIVYVQVGSSGAKGTITTPLLTNCTGNLRVNTSFYAIDSNISFASWLLKEDDYTNQKYCFVVTETGRWNHNLPTMLYRNTGPLSKIIFFSADAVGQSATRRFQIANIKICDIGENIFYETFDGNNGVGGNDEDFSEESEKAPSADNPLSTLKNIFAGNKCLLLSTANSDYTTPVLPTTTSGQAILTFRAAGTTYADDHEITLSATGATLGTTSVNATEGVWNEFSVNLTAMTSAVTVTFSSKSCFLDEIRIREKALETLTMNQAHSEGDNDNFDAMTVGTVANVMLTRTLTADIWNTLCLPFRFDNTMLAGENHILRLTSVTDGCFNFTEDDAVPAGEPFLLKVGSTAENPTFNNVTIRTTSPGTKMFGDYGLQGIFYATNLATDESNAFLGTDGSLYYPSVGSKTMYGLRAYFVKPSAASARVSFSISEPTAIHELHPESIAHEYNLWGQRVTSSRRGIIIRNGKKIFRQ